MPNWCNNTVYIRISEEFKSRISDLDLAKLGDAARENNLLRTIIPIPADIMHRDDYSWYEFCVDNWGNPWDIRCESANLTDGVLAIYFRTAWVPPIPVYRELRKRGYDVEAYPDEVGIEGAWVNGFETFKEYEIEDDEVE